ncbi:MAG: VOC family protein [Owenweeksia sp.]
MIKLAPYLNFNGKCAEAMTFYKDCLSGTVEMNKIGESPMAEHFPEDQHNGILHSILTSDHITIMGTDAGLPGGHREGNDFSLCLFGDDEKLFHQYFDKLAKGGTVQEKLAKAPWGDMFGALTDKFGKNWMFNCSPKS